jgi:hypothetical protein
MAAAYLVMACGTGGDNITTSWSGNAIKKHTKISRQRAKEAIERLIQKRLVTKVNGVNPPRYKMATWAQFIGKDRDRTPLTEAQSETLEIIKAGGQLSAKQKTIAHQLVRMRHAQFVHGVPQPFEPPAPELAFLPNAFVTSAEDEAPPNERLRNRGDAGLFRLIVDLYHQHLANDGGIEKNVLLKEYGRSNEAQIGPYKIAKFAPKGPMSAYLSHQTIAPHCSKKPDGKQDASIFWARLEALEDAGLIEWIPTLFEAPGLLAEPLFPLGIGDSNSLEDQLGDLAHTAAASLVSRHWNLDHIPETPLLKRGETHLVPLPKAYDRAIMVGIARLRYRPHTQRTSEWLATIEDRSKELRKKWAKIIEDFSQAKREAA